MPYHWSDDTTGSNLRLWPHQSMTPQGFSWFIGTTAVLLALPLLAVLGSVIVWVLMAFFLAALTAVWRAITANQRARSTEERLILSDTHLDLQHIPPNGAPLTWEANRHWVTVNLRNDGPVDNYLTLRGGGREVELGAFLTPQERLSLYDDLRARLSETP